MSTNTDNNKRSSYQIIISSTLSSIISTTITNPLDVIRVRQQKSSCQQNYNKKNYLNTSLNQNQNSIAQAINKCKNTLNQQITTSKSLCQNIPKFAYGCQVCKTEICFSNLNLLQSFQHLFKKEGPQSLFNGLKFNLMTVSAGNLNYFYFYEKTQKILEQQFNLKQKNSQLFYLSSALIARFFATTITFPLDYLRTIAFAQEKNKNIKNLQKSKNNQGFSSILQSKGIKITLQRDLMFSGIYWFLVENIREQLKKQQTTDFYGKQSYKDIVANNIIAGSTSGAIASYITLPIDVVKTRLQVIEKNNNNNNNKKGIISQIYKIYNEEGVNRLFSGAQPRFIRASLQCTLVLSLYEVFISLTDFKEKLI